MKIPENISISSSSSDIKLWDKTATEMSMKYGIYIQFDIKWRMYNNSTTSNSVDELLFKIGDNYFGSLVDLEKALKNKSFI